MYEIDGLRGRPGDVFASFRELEPDVQQMNVHEMSPWLEAELTDLAIWSAGIVREGDVIRTRFEEESLVFGLREPTPEESQAAAAPIPVVMTDSHGLPYRDLGSNGRPIPPPRPVFSGKPPASVKEWYTPERQALLYRGFADSGDSVSVAPTSPDSESVVVDAPISAPPVSPDKLPVITDSYGLPYVGLGSNGGSIPPLRPTFSSTPPVPAELWYSPDRMALRYTS